MAGADGSLRRDLGADHLSVGQPARRALRSGPLGAGLPAATRRCCSRVAPPGARRELAELELPLTFRYDAASGLTPEALPQPPPGATTRPCDWSLRVGDFFLVTDKPARARDAYRDGSACLDRERRRDAGWARAPARRRRARRRACSTTTTDPESRVQRGYALLRLGNAQRGARRLRRRAEVTAYAGQIDADATLGRALALEALHRDDEALAAFRELPRPRARATSAPPTRARTSPG